MAPNKEKKRVPVNKGQKKVKSSAQVKACKKKGVPERQEPRDKNWTGGEMDALVDSCIQNIDTIDANLSAEVTKEVKNKLWQSIADGVNG